MTDPTILHDAASTLLGVLKDGAVDNGWDDDSVFLVAAGEPSYDCRAVYVWVDQIVPEVGQGGCVTASTVRFRFGIADCVGADRDETEIFGSAQSHMEMVWSVWSALVQHCCTNAQLILGPYADTVRVGTVQQVTTSGGVAVWLGQVTGVLSVTAAS